MTTGTDPTQRQDEEREILAIEGTTVTIAALAAGVLWADTGGFPDPDREGICVQLYAREPDQADS